MPEEVEVAETEVAATEATATEATATEATATEAKVVAATAPAAAATGERHNRKTREGLVVSDKMDKTAVVAVIERVRHAKYGKFMMRTKRLYAHDETNDAHVGDKVRVMETRPLSKNKRWRVVEVLERAK
jgi:small subunit ribosomal protein S17